MSGQMLWLLLAVLVIVVLLLRLMAVKEQMMRFQQRIEDAIRDAQSAREDHHTAEETIGRLTTQLGSLLPLAGHVEERARERAEEWQRNEQRILRESIEAALDREYKFKLEQWTASAEASIRTDALQRSQSVTAGKIAEHLLPYVPGWFTYNPKDARFLGSPVDFIVFDGLDEDSLRDVVLIEVKTGAADLTRRERQIRDAILAGRVRWEQKRADAHTPQNVGPRLNEVTNPDHLTVRAGTSQRQAPTLSPQPTPSRQDVPSGQSTGFALPPTAYTTRRMVDGIQAGIVVHTHFVGKHIGDLAMAGGALLDVIRILKGINRHHACVLLVLTSTKRLIAAVDLLAADGSDGLSLDPLLIPRHASTWDGCTAIVVGGNRVTGTHEPIDRDHEFVKRLRAAAAEVQIELQDYIIYSDTRFTSFRESGRLQE